MGGDALRAVARGSLSIPRQVEGTWREWAGGLSTAKIAGGTVILSAAALALAAAVHATRQKAHTQSTKELIDMYIKASEDDSDTRAMCLVSRVHELRDALGMSGLWAWNAERKIAAKHILEDICRIKVAQNRNSPSRALEAQIKFLKDAARSPLAQKFPRKRQPYQNAGIQLAPQADADMGVPYAVPHGTHHSISSPSHMDVTRMAEHRLMSDGPKNPKHPTFTYAFAHDELDDDELHRVSVPNRSAASENKEKALPTRLADVTANMTSLNVGKHSQYGHVATWDVRYVSDMSSAFESTLIDATDLADLSFWDTRNVTTMASMFSDATTFNGEIGDWNTHKVTDMSQMFCGATLFNSDITRWDVQSVIQMYCMFRGALEFNQDISEWIVNSARQGPCEQIGSMFSGATAFSHRGAVERKWKLSAEKRNAAFPLNHATGKAREGRVFL
jgi:hypothetical protein